MAQHSPQHSIHPPVWAALADTLIDRLARHHNAGSSTRTRRRRSDPPSELDDLLKKFESLSSADRPAAPVGQPSRQVPARQVMAAIRLAATVGSEDALHDLLQDRGLTVLGGISIDDLPTIGDVLAAVFPHHRWQIISPDAVDGTLAKGAQRRFENAIVDALDVIRPVLILQPDSIALSAVLRAVAPTMFTLAPISRAVITQFVAAGSLSHEISSFGELHEALPADEALAQLTSIETCAALRAPTLYEGLMRLHQIVHPQGGAGNQPHLEDRAGDGAALQAARRIVADLLDWRAGRAEWHEISHSLLLHGAPGTGKSWLAQAMGNSAGLSLVTATFGEWQAAGHLGEMLREMRGTFAEARRKAPCLLVIDEIDAVGSRSDPDRHASHYRTQVITAFLAEMDQISRQEGVIVVGTCNDASRMDPAVLRAGRMDLKIEVPLPDSNMLFTALRRQLPDRIDDDALQQLARQAVGRTFADMDAAIRAARSDARHADTPMSAATIAAHLGVSLAAEDRACLWRIAVHEAGHAVLAAALQLGPVEHMMISLAGGQIARRDIPNQTRLADIEAEITHLLGGRAAEQLVLGEVSAGAGGPASSDLALATRHAIHIETRYGVGFEGPVWHADPDEVHLSTPAIRDRVRQRLQHAERRANTILERHREVLEELARALLEQRSMRAAEIRPWLERVTFLQSTADLDHVEERDGAKSLSVG